MNFDWSNYLYLAQELAGRTRKSTSREARLRSAISRAYYAAFILAHNYLREKEGLAVPGDDAHWFVINEFRNSHDLLRRQIGRDLNRLRRERNKADYDNDFMDLPEITRRVLRTAEQIIANLGKL